MSLRKVPDLQQLALSSLDFSQDRMCSSIVEMSYRSLGNDNTRQFRSVGMKFKDFAEQSLEVFPPWAAQLSGVSGGIKTISNIAGAIRSAVNGVSIERWHIYVDSKRQPVEKYVFTRRRRSINISNCDVSLDPESYFEYSQLSVYEYSGKRPSVFVTLADGTPLAEGIDYSIAYIGDSGTITHQSQGIISSDAAVRLSGLNDYYGTVSVPYVISHEYYVPKLYHLSAATVSLTPSICSVTNFESAYSFDSIRPDVSATMLIHYQLSTLEEGKDYEVSCLNNTSSLVHDGYGPLTLSSEVILSGIGGFTGAVSLAYPLTHTYARKPSVAIQVTDISSKTVSWTSAEYNAQNRWFWNISCAVFSFPAEQMSAYVASAYSLSPDYVSNVILHCRKGWPSAESCTYVVWLSSSYAGAFTEDNAVAVVEISSVSQPKDSLSGATVTLDPGQFAFSGAYAPYTYENIRPSVSVALSGKALQENVDYVVAFEGDSGQFSPASYQTVTNEASVYIEGVNAYGGSVSATYPIVYTYHSPMTQYAVSLMANDSTYGTVAGGGIFDEGTEVSACAYANDGYSFVRWRDADGEKSAVSAYLFNLTSDVSLTAEFMESNP